MNEDCPDYGNRMKDFPKCQPCPEKICMKCSVLTLEKVLSEHPRKIDIITPSGRSVTISKGKETENE